MPKKPRLDALLVARGLAESRSQAQRLIMAGQVRVNGEVALKAGQMVPPDAEIAVAQPPPFVSRGGEKLAAALEAFPLSVAGRVCADVGSSTGGFTDCMLQHGARRVYALDVGKGQLHWKLRNDPRVVVMESTNARYVARLPEPVTLVTIDVSFISLRVLLPVIYGWFPEEASIPVSSLALFSSPEGISNSRAFVDPPITPLYPPSSPLTKGGRGGKGSSGGETQGGVGGIEKTASKLGTRGDVVALVKPQFEAGRREAARGKGVIRDPAVHWRVLREVLDFAQANGYSVRGLIRSPVRGPKGNVEFLAWLGVDAPPADEAALTRWIEACVTS